MYKYSISIKCTKMAIYHMAILWLRYGYPVVWVVPTALTHEKPLKNNLNYYKPAIYENKKCDEIPNFSDEIFV